MKTSVVRRLADQVHHRRRGVARGLAGPGRRLGGVEDADVGLGAGVGERAPGCRGRGSRRGPRGPRRWRRGRRGASPAPGSARRARPRASWSPRFEFGQRVDLVDDHPREAGEDLRRLRVGEHEGEGLRRGQQDVRRVDALAGALGGAGVGGAVLDADGEAELGDRRGEVAADVGGERLQRRDVEGVEAGRRRGAERDEAGEEARQRLAAAGRGDEQRRGVGGAGEERELVRVRRPSRGGRTSRRRPGGGLWPSGRPGRQGRQARKLAISRRPVAWLFSGWNWVPARLSRATMAVIGVPCRAIATRWRGSSGTRW